MPLRPKWKNFVRMVDSMPGRGRKIAMGSMVSAITAALTVSVLLVQPTYSENTVNWLTYEQAQKIKHPAQPGKYMVYFYADWCRYCKAMDNETFKNQEIADYINNNFIPVRVNIDKEKQVAAFYGISGVPDLRFISSEGETIARVPGYVKPDRVLLLLKYIHSDSYLTQEFEAYLKSQS